MSKTLGFFLGSAAVFAALVYILGQPVRLAPPEQRQPVAQSGGFARTAPIEVPQVAEPAVDEAPLAVAEEPLVAQAPEPEDATDYELAQQWLESGPQEYGPPAPAPESLPQEPAMPAEPAEVAEPEWYPVWDPFHSELSANAFARRLERITGLDYRVIKTDPARYRVAVGYHTEEQRIANVAAIEEATGLTITGGSR